MANGEVEDCADAAFLSAVKDIQNLDYFENKRLQTDLACAKWLDILAINWSASAIGQQVCEISGAIPLERWRMKPSRLVVVERVIQLCSSVQEL